jgi:hypothetical protein
MGLADFNVSTFLQSGWFTAAEFEGGARFNLALFSGPALFDKTHIASHAEFQRATFQRHADFSESKIDVEGSFDNARFPGGVDFSQSSLASATFTTNRFIGAGGMFGGGLAWTNCELEHIRADWPSLASHLAYNLQTHQQLEKAFKNTGEEDAAQAAYLNRQNHERKSRWSEHKYLEYCLSWLSWISTDYAVSPRRVLWAMVIVLACGTIMFSFRGSLVLKSQDASPGRHSVWQALAVAVVCFMPDKLLPESFVARVPLVPSEAPVFKRIPFSPATIGTILAFCGWVFVPLTIFVLGILMTGLIPGKS